MLNRSESNFLKTSAMVIGALILGALLGYQIPKNTPSAVATHGIENGSMMPSAMNSMTANLQGKSGDEFDKAFIQEMTLHHQGAVAMAELASTTTSRTELKELAQDIIAAQTSEITMMRGWLDEWFR